MREQLYINGKDAYTQYGVTMGENFISALDTPPALKDHIKNEVRGENGTQYVVTTMPKVASREVSLNFYIQADTQEAYMACKDDFLSELSKGIIEMYVPVLAQTYRLLYTGRNVSYALSIDRTSAKLGAKFIEPNPVNRN